MVNGVTGVILFGMSEKVITHYSSLLHPVIVQKIIPVPHHQVEAGEGIAKVADTERGIALEGESGIEFSVVVEQIDLVLSTVHDPDLTVGG